MTTTLHFRKTPKPTKDEAHFKVPVKAIIAGRYYDHDGSLSGRLITLGPGELPWFEGVLAGGLAQCDTKDRADFARIVEMLRDGESVDMWID